MPSPLCTAALVALVAALAAPPAAACGPERAKGRRGDLLQVGFVDGPPWVIANGGDQPVQGAAVALLQTVAAEEGWRLELVELSAEALRVRLAACELDLGIVGAVINADMLRRTDDSLLELSVPYALSQTTALVRANDGDRAARIVHRGLPRRIAEIVLHCALAGLIALAILAVASWALNRVITLRGQRRLRWRRINATIRGPWTGLVWLLRTTAGRVLMALWLAVGVAVQASVELAPSAAPVDDSDPLTQLIDRAAHKNELIAERASDATAIACPPDDARTCFRGLIDHRISAIAGPRDVLCMYAVEALPYDEVVLRDDLGVPEQLAYLMPPESPLQARLDFALLRHRERAPRAAAAVLCPGDPR